MEDLVDVVHRGDAKRGAFIALLRLCFARKGKGVLTCSHPEQAPRMEHDNEVLGTRSRKQNSLVN